MTKEELQIREIFNRYRKALHIQKLNEEGYLYALEENELEDLAALKKTSITSRND